jgi:hypothetical protein
MAELKKAGDLVRLRRDLKTGSYKNDLFLILEMGENDWSFHAHAIVWNIMRNEKMNFYCMDLELLERRK